VELTLVHQEQLTLTVPEKTAYTITELAGAYTASYQITDSEGLNRINRSADYNTEENTALSTKSETADAGEKVAVVFTNVKDVRQKLTLQKILEDVSSGTTDQFEFTINLTGLKPGCILHSTLGALTAEDDGAVTASFLLTSGTSFEIEDIPVGVSYEVIESESEYVASYQIMEGQTNVANSANAKPDLSLTTGSHTIQVNKDPQVVFSNRKVACDITITKKIDMTYGNLLESEYKQQSFDFEIVLTGLGNLKYNEIMVEYNKDNNSDPIKKTLADVMSLSEAEGEQTAAERVTFIISLHHNESFRLKGLPYNSTCHVTEQASADYIASYTINHNEDAQLQAAPKANTKKNTALSLNAAEIIDPNDKDIEFVFTNQYEFAPYILPAAGTNDTRPWLAFIFVGFLFCAGVYFVVNRKRKSNVE